jgi:hypothetical protein
LIPCIFFFDGNTITIQKPLLVAEAMLQDSSVKNQDDEATTTLSCVGSKSVSWANAHEWHGSCWVDETRNCAKWTSCSRHVPNTLAIILLCRVFGYWHSLETKSQESLLLLLIAK